MKSERIGLLIIFSSLVVITLIIGLFFDYQQDSRLNQIRAQGVSLVRLLTRMPFAQLVTLDNQKGPLQIIKSTQDNPSFAYGIVVDPQGNSLVEVNAPGVMIPFAQVNSQPSLWFGERTVSVPGSGHRYREFMGPVISEGERVAHVRIGYSEPNFFQAYRQLSFFAMLALPIFLLATLFYYLIRIELKPLKQANTHIKSMLQDNPIHRVELKASGEVGEFINHFNKLILTAEKRIHYLEGEHTGLETSTKVLSYQKARVESVLESMPEGIFVIDEAGTVTFANQKLPSLIGLEQEKIMGREPRQWCQKPELLEFISSYIGKTPRRNAVGQLEFAPDHAPDKRISVSAYPLFSPREEARIYGTLVVVKDITLETMAKRARSEFVAHVAHELKTPLHVIGMYSEMLLTEEGEENEVRIDAANVINDEIERVAMLIKNMLNITKIEMGSVSLDRQRVRLREFLQDAFKNITRSREGDKLDCKLETLEELTPIYIDKDFMRVAINNLLTNAIKYNKPSGQLVLGAEEDNDQIVIFVRDTGIGIRPEDQLRIFDKFFRSEDAAHNEVTGHGLGLSLVKEVVDLHHGEINLQSTPGEGSEFKIILKKTPALLREAV